jgi:UDP-glucose 4-epimerase
MPGALSADISRVVVLGHSGFIGQALTARLRADYPDLEVLGLSRAECELTDWGSVRTALYPIFDDSTAVVVCSGIKKQWGDSLDIFSKNLQMATNLCRLLEERPVRRLVFFSSAEVYGEELNELRITEATPVAPSSYYGTAKYASERLFAKLAGGGNLSLLVLRPPLVYGAGDTSRGYGPAGFVRCALDRESVTLWGDGSELRSLLFIDDLARFASRLTLDSCQGVVNLAGPSTSFTELLDLVSGLVPGGITSSSRPRTKGKTDNAYQTELLQRLIPGLSFTPLAEGLRLTLQQMRNSQP